MKKNISSLVYEILGILFQLGGLVYLFILNWKIGLAFLFLSIGGILYSKK